MSRQANGNRNERGMSILELMIVLFIIMAVTVVALPQLREATESYRLTAVAGEVSGVMGHARILAVTRNKNYRVNVTASDTYLVQQQDSGSWITQDTYELPDGFAFSTTGSIVAFLPRGNARPATTLTITNPNAISREVVVELSGRSYAQTPSP